MKLPENPTKKVREIITAILQCPGYKISENEKDLYEIKKLCDVLDTTIQECKELQAKLELAMSQNYCTMCGNILDGYVPPEEKK